jgi:hypothetical protein
LKRLLADAELDKAMLEEIAEGDLRPRTVAFTLGARALSAARVDLS